MDEFASVFKTWSLPILVLDRELNIAYCNAAYEAATQRTLTHIQGHYVFEIFPETVERVEAVRHLFLKAFEGETTSLDEVRFNLLGEDGITTERVWQATQEPYRNSEGQVTHIIQRADDVTSAVQARLESQLVREELNHRMKNVHTVVQAMARLSSRSAESLEEFRDSFLGRMDSMSRAHERLMRSGMISVDLKHLLEDEIKGVAPDMESTVNLRGPSTLLYAELSRSFSMLIHELATNAVKYGCFSTANGALDVKWDVKDETLQLSWSETGLENLTPPSRLGFGSKMIKMLPNVDYQTEYRPTGLLVTIILPLSAG
jgi:PAS domain S-box-containing protein